MLKMTFKALCLSILLGISCLISARHHVLRLGTKAVKVIKVVLFDIGGVLAETSYFRMSKDIGWRYPINYMFKDFKNPNIKTLCFKTLERLFGPQKVHAGELMAFRDGLVLPQIMCDWLTDSMTPTEIRHKVTHGISKLAKEGYFSSKNEREYVLKILLTMFCSPILARNTLPIKAAIKLTDDIAAQCNSQRKPRFIQAILSNYASEPFNLVFNGAQCAPVFKHIDRRYVFTSGSLHDLKPRHSIYSTVIQKFINDGIITNASEIVFIDDQEENVIAARQCGMTALHLKNGDYKTLRKQLRALGILLSKK
ncbi:MAG: hypothetical protein WA432_01125 [Candidatus Babeliaceae bacterium]